MQNYFEKYQRFVTKLPFGNLSLVVLFINLIIVLLATFARSILPPVVPLFYGRPYGIEQLTPAGTLALPGLAALSICIISIAISLAAKDDFLKKVLFGSMVVVTVLAVIATIKIILLVGAL